MVEYGDLGRFALESGEVVEVVSWYRPYGIPYARTSDGKEYHRDQLNRV